MTVDLAFSITEAVAVTGGVISAVGTDDDLMPSAGPDTVVVDLDGQTVIPGFVETHTHALQLPAPDLAGMRAGQQELIQFGITTAGMPSVFPDELEAFRQLESAGEIRIRSHLYVAYNSVCGERDLGAFYLENEFNRDPDARLALAGVKIFADGGTCGGPAMSIEYLDTAPQTSKDAGWAGTGDLFVTADEITSVLSEVDAAGGQTVIHAMGDVAIATALEGVEQAGDLTQPRQIHHNSFAAMLDPDVLAIYGDMGLTPVMMLMPWAQACEPGLTELWQSIVAPEALELVETYSAIMAASPGIRIAWHGDGPYVPGGPLQHMFTQVTTGSADAGEVCYPEAWAGRATLSVEEVLRMTTINAAAAMGYEEHFGSIEIGKHADLVILENDIFDPDPEVAFAWNRPTATIVGGKVEFCTGDLCPGLDGSPDGAPDHPQPPSNECVAAPEGLVGWWPGDRTADDALGNNHGVTIDGASFASGVVGDAFNIAGGAVAFDTFPAIEDAFTIEAWVQFDGTSFDDFQNVFNNERFFLRKNNAVEGNNFAIFVNLTDGSVEPRAESATVAAPWAWNHLAATWDGAELRLFVNGVLEGASARVGELIDTATPPQIGRGEQANLDGPWFYGQIDEFAIYDAALQADSIASIANAGTGGKCPLS
ncbi:MAG: amidohydrolase family protein [Actinomycetia bacterium]|nr:amidohydrolase family protein [Actinomycetes bacterium]